MKLHPPQYPLTEHEGWLILQTDFESGVEQVVQRACYQNREWDISYKTKVNSDDLEYIRNFVDRKTKDNTVFLWREPVKTSRDHVLLGHGDFQRTTWLLPLIEVNSLTVYVNSLAVDVGAGVGSGTALGTGTASLGIVSLPAPPNYSDVVTFSYMDSYYCPMVVMRDVFQFQLQAPPHYGEIMFTLKEVKKGYPAA